MLVQRIAPPVREGLLNVNLNPLCMGFLVGAVIERVNGFADGSCIAPPGQEGCREATGWWFKETFW